MFKIIQSVNGFAVETYDKADAAKLADYIDHLQNWYVTEVVFSWATEQCIIRCYPTDQTSGQTELNNLISRYYE